MQFKVWFDDERFTSTIVDLESLEEARAQHPDAVSVERFDPFGIGPSADEVVALGELFSNDPSPPSLPVECGNCQNWHRWDNAADGICKLSRDADGWYALCHEQKKGCHQFNWDPQVLRLRLES